MMRFLLFGGTSEGRELAQWLDTRDTCEVLACTATPYGEELLSGLDRVSSHAGPLSHEEKERLVGDNDFACIIDATHPFATHVSESVRRLAQAHGIPLVRVLRENPEPPFPYTQAPDVREAAAYVAQRRGNILLTTGTRDLEVFVRAVVDFAERLFVRVLPVADSVSRAHELGLPVNHIIAMQGPFSVGLNEALLRELSISVMVAKASGVAGGLPQKLEAAQACGVEAVVVGRPSHEEGVTLEQAKRLLEVRYGA